VLLAAARAAADQLLELGVHQEVPEPQPVRFDPRLGQALGELPPRLRLAVSKGLGEHAVAADEDVRVELEPSVPVAVERVNARTGEPQQPAQVLARDEVPRRAQHVRADDVAAVQCGVDVRLGARACALAQRPLRLGELLGLHRSEPAHSIAYVVEWLAREALLGQASPHGVERIHQPVRPMTTTGKSRTSVAW